MRSYSKIVAAFGVCGMLLGALPESAQAIVPCKSQLNALNSAAKRSARYERKRDISQSKLESDDERYDTKIENYNLRKANYTALKQNCNSLWSILTAADKLLQCNQKYDNLRNQMNAKIGSTQNAKAARRAKNDAKVALAQSRLDTANVDTAAKQTAYDQCMNPPPAP